MIRGEVRTRRERKRGRRERERERGLPCCCAFVQQEQAVHKPLRIRDLPILHPTQKREENLSFLTYGIQTILFTYVTSLRVVHISNTTVNPAGKLCRVTFPGLDKSL